MKSRIKAYKKFIHKQGFTMAELLIVVAIIAVLVAVAIPIFTTQLEKSRETVDIQLMRTVASKAQTLYYEGACESKDAATAAGLAWWSAGSDTNTNSNAWAIYNPDTGEFYSAYDGTVAAYGKGTATDGGTLLTNSNGRVFYDGALDYSNSVCQIAIYPNGNNKRIEVAWKSWDNKKFVGKGIGKYSDSEFPCYVISLE